MIFSLRRSSFVGVLVLLGLLIFAGGCGSVKVAENAPADLYGAWQTAPGDETVYHLLFLADGEYRVAVDATLLYDDPLFLGRYQYEAGQLTFINAGLDEQNCREPGQYVVVSYDDNGDPQLTLARTDDKCEQRYTVLTHAVWQMAAVEG